MEALAPRLISAPGAPCSSQHLQQRPLRLAPACKAARQQRRRQGSCRASLGPVPEAAPGAGLSPELKSAIDQFISENRVVAFIKGTKQMPMCGFSNTMVQILNSFNIPYVTVNVLEDDLLRSGLKEYSSWPTFPQLYVAGDFVGGCDIAIAAYQSGELAELLEKAFNE